MTQAAPIISGMGKPAGVCADPPHHARLVEIAGALAQALELPLVRDPEHTIIPLLLTVTARRLELRVAGGEPALRGGRPVAPDLTRIDATSAPGGRLNQPLLKAIGLKKGQPRPNVLDVTAGFGEDAWLLAAVGCRVLAVERHPVVATLLRDALRRAAEQKPEPAERLLVLQEDGRELLRAFQRDGQVTVPAEGSAEEALPVDTESAGPAPSSEAAETSQAEAPDEEAEPEEPGVALAPPDAVYIDPMFPASRKTAERKPMRVLRQLVGENIDSGELLALALKVAHRVVVKRPRKAEPLGGRRPTTVQRGRALRYDLYTR
jgi:16S rRNA (guanine1516-N2)-methyltransferase